MTVEKFFREDGYIGGEWCGGANKIAVTNPANGETIGHVPDFGREEARAAIAAALAALESHQPLGRATGAAHAAAFCTPEGAIRLVREDVGRHNALDKLVGAMMRAGINARQGFILLSARCSYELVDKTVRAGCPMLVTISAPTSLAADRAEAAGLTLVSLARRDSALVLCDPQGLIA